MTTSERPAGAPKDRLRVRPLTDREVWTSFAATIALGPFLAQVFPFFAGDFDTLNSEGLIPLFIAYEVGCIVWAGALFWLLTYVLRFAAASPRAPRWLSRAMDPGAGSAG